MWHYRPCKRKDKSGDYYFCVVEFFPKCVNGKDLWTRDAIKPVAYTRQELIKDLEMMLKDCKHYKTLDDTKEKI